MSAITTESEASAITLNAFSSVMYLHCVKKMRMIYSDVIYLIICIITRNDVFVFWCVFFLFLEVSISALPWYLTVVVLAQCIM